MQAKVVAPFVPMKNMSGTLNTETLTTFVNTCGNTFNVLTSEPCCPFPVDPEVCAHPALKTT